MADTKFPGMTTENQVLMDRVDPDLSPEEQTTSATILGYADALMRGAEENASPEPGELLGGRGSRNPQKIHRRNPG